MLIARGGGIRPGTSVARADILDLAPTVTQLLKVETAMPVAGRPIPELVA